MDGLLGARIEIDRPPETALPLDVGAANYCVFRGMVMKSFIYFQGAADIALGKRAKARLYLGDAQQVAPLHDLGIEQDAIFTAFLPSTAGVLDDHFECWFMTSADGQHGTGEGLESVIDLGRSEEWLDPPKVRVGSAR